MNDIPQYMFMIAWLGLALFALSFMWQAMRIVNEYDGYRQNPKVKSHPEMEEVKGTGVLMGITFDGPKPELPELDDDDPFKKDPYEALQERVRQKRESLWEEPSTYEDDDDEDDDDDGVAVVRR